MRAIVVDDSKAMRAILKRLLTECGYSEILEAGSGREGLDAIAAVEPIELVLVDGNLPEMSTIEFATAVRANAQCGVNLLVITNETDQTQSALAAGADECVMKPFTKEVLLEKLDIIKSGRA